MKKKTLGLTAIAISCITLTSALLVIGNNVFLSLANTNENSIIFDHSHNYSLDEHSSNYFYRFDARTSKGADIGFLEQHLYSDSSNNWRYCSSSSGGLLNTDKIGGLTDITVTFTEHDDDEHLDSIVKVKYGWEVGSTPSGSYETSPLNKYEESLSSGISFDFGDKLPSYFYIYFENVDIESIVIHYTCEEHLPDYSEEEHYELVKSMSEINNEDIYTISSTKDEAGYVMSRTKRPSGEDKLRMAEGCAPSNEMILADENILQLKITSSAGLYYFQAQNYLGTNTQGYFNTLDTSNNNSLYIETEANKSGFDVSIDSTSYQFNVLFNGSNVTKRLMFYSSASDTYFNCFAKTGGSEKHPIYLYKYVDVAEETITLNSSNLSSMSKSYSNGNYGSLSTGGKTYEYYRKVKSTSGYAFSMINPDFYYADGGYPSSFYNVPSSPIYGIKNIQVTYKATAGIKIGYSKDVGDESYSSLASAADFVTRSINVTKMNFFKIMTNGSDAYVKDITITYTNKVELFDSDTSYSENRKVVAAYSGTLVNGVTTHTMYISPSVTKTYTYYSKEYAYNNYSSIDKDKAFMIDPVDVCNYYLAFHQYPANFVTSSEKSTYGSKFGSYARQLSPYSRTDGYARSVPYNNKPGQSTPSYVELDIDLNGAYSLSNRQVGRVVVWEYGFSCYGSTDPVCVYTDDHYATFQEYNGMGGFAHRFNSERQVAGKVYCPLTTI